MNTVCRWFHFSAKLVLPSLAILLLSAATVCYAAPTEAKSSPLEFVTEELPPLTFAKNGQADGFGADVVRELLHRNNLTAPLTVLPWARAYMMAHSQPNVGLYCLALSEERKNQFQWVGPLANIESKFFANQTSQLHVENMADARKAAGGIIVLREGYNAQMLAQLKFKNVIAANNPVEAIRILRLRGDEALLLIESNTLRSTAAKLDLLADAIKPLLTVTKTQVYIGFSLDTPNSLITNLQHSLNAMKTDGSFAAIYKKWLPGDKPPGVEADADVFPQN